MHNSPKITALLCIAILTLSAFSAVYGQNVPISKTRILPPSAETFKPYDGIISPGTPELRLSKDTLKVYDTDGRIWYEASFDYRHPLFYRNNVKNDLLPFSSYGTYPLAMRIRAVSDNWYEVITNEETDESKFTLIKDPFLKRETWNSVIDGARFFIFDPNSNPVHDAPDGSAVESDFKKGEQLWIKTISNDWVEIRRYGRGPTGWIKWRDDTGRFILGIESNNWKLPGSDNKLQEKSLSKSIDMSNH